MRPTSSMWPFAVPTSENEPRVPGPRPNADALVKLYDEPGFPKFGCMNGKLFPSRRIRNLTRSLTCHGLASDSCVQVSPGPSNVFRPRVPAVNAAGYPKESIFRYGFCAEVGKRSGPMSQSGMYACSTVVRIFGRDSPGRYRLG